MPPAHGLTVCVGAHLLCIAVFILSSASQAQRRQVYVKSTPDQQCPLGCHCRYTFLNYLHNTSATLSANTTLHFLPGKHSAVSPHNMTLVISNVSNLVLTDPKVGPGEPPQASIWCNYTMQFHFRNITVLTVRRILFTECGTSQTSSEKELFPSLFPPFDSSNPPAALQFNSVENITLEHVHITWSDGHGLLALNNLGYCSITTCKFSNNGRTRGARIGGNAHFVFQQNEQSTDNVLLISNSEISHGLDNNNYHSSPTVGGMMIVIRSISVQYQLNISILSCNFHDNEAISGANLRIDLCILRPQVTLIITLKDSTFKRGSTVQYYGGGLTLTDNNLVTQDEFHF